MATRIRITAVLVIIAVIIASLVALNIESKMEIDEVKSASLESSTASTATIQWKNVGNADGYKLYLLDQNGEYELFKNIDDKKANSVTLEGLESSTVYTFKISAYRYFRNKEYESELSENSFEVYTLPETPDAIVSSNFAYKLNVKWSAQENVKGYELEYSQNENLSDSTTIELTENTFELDKLKQKNTYYVRVRAFFEYNEEVIYSEWSEVGSAKIKDKVVMSDSIDPDKPMIAFSFDDGPGYESDGVNPTMVILDTLESYNARATFFMVGSRIGSDNVAALEKEIEIGCELGNHTMYHTHYGSDVTISDISDCSDTIYNWVEHYPSIFRCPGGIVTSTIENECIAEGMPLAYWSVDTKDWDLKDTEKIYDNIMNGVYDGCIVLMHDIYLTTAEAVQKAVPELVEQGYQIVTVSELIYYKTGSPAEAGVQYVDSETTNNNT